MDEKGFRSALALDFGVFHCHLAELVVALERAGATAVTVVSSDHLLHHGVPAASRGLPNVVGQRTAAPTRRGGWGGCWLWGRHGLRHWLRHGLRHWLGVAALVSLITFIALITLVAIITSKAAPTAACCPCAARSKPSQCKLDKVSQGATSNRHTWRRQGSLRSSWRLH